MWAVCFHGGGGGLLHSHTPAAGDEPHGHDNQIIPRQRALSARMCSHKEPWKLRGPAEFPQAGEATIPFAHSVQRAVAEAAGKKASTEEGLRGGVLTPLRLFHWWEVFNTSSLSTRFHQLELDDVLDFILYSSRLHFLFTPKPDMNQRSGAGPLME